MSQRSTLPNIGRSTLQSRD